MKKELAIEQPLKVMASDSRIIISIGINRLNGNEYHPTISEFQIKNARQWGEDVVNELERETTEQGNTILSDAFDKAILEAIEQGSCAIKKVEEKKTQLSLSQQMRKDGWGLQEEQQ